MIAEVEVRVSRRVSRFRCHEAIHLRTYAYLDTLAYSHTDTYLQ